MYGGLQLQFTPVLVPSYKLPISPYYSEAGFNQPCTRGRTSATDACSKYSQRYSSHLGTPYNKYMNVTFTALLYTQLHLLNTLHSSPVYTVQLRAHYMHATSFHTLYILRAVH